MFNNLGLALGMAFKFSTSVEKEFKAKRQKVLEANPYVYRSYRGKLVWGSFWSPHPEQGES